MTIEEEIKNLLSKYPFMSFVVYGKSEYVGIIQNIDQYVTNFYDFSRLTTNDQKEKFLSLGEQWWWESNRLIPINIFLKSDWGDFRFCLRTFTTKDVTVKYGPQVNISQLANKRIKRRQIVLVKKVV